LEQTDIAKLAAAQGILTIIPTFKTGIDAFGIDSATQLSFKEILISVVAKYKLNKLPFFIGGFSIGGSCAVKFAELAVQENYKFKPTAIFAIDPPLDFERFYHAAKRNIRLSKNRPINQEEVYFSKRIELEMNGTPETSLINYFKLSPYSFNDSTQSAIKSLGQMPIRLYCEPDINWWLSNRGDDYFGMNVFDCALMINELNRLGNNKAVLVITHKKGFRRPGNFRHPHSWSIAAPKQLITWLLHQH